MTDRGQPASGPDRPRGIRAAPARAPRPGPAPRRRSGIGRQHGQQGGLADAGGGEEAEALAAPAGGEGNSAPGRRDRAAARAAPVARPAAARRAAGAGWRRAAAAQAHPAAGPAGPAPGRARSHRPPAQRAGQAGPGCRRRSPPAGRRRARWRGRRAAPRPPPPPAAPPGPGRSSRAPSRSQGARPSTENATLPADTTFPCRPTSAIRRIAAAAARKRCNA